MKKKESKKLQKLSFKKMYKQIAENKRKTVYLIIAFVAMMVAIAGLFAWAYDDWKIAVWTLIISIIYAVIQYFYANSVAVAMTGAKEITKKDYYWLTDAKGIYC